MKQRFKTLPIGARFIFASQEDPRFSTSGMERGPWVKTGSRKYCKAPGELRPMDCKVGTVNVEVIAL